MPTLPQLGRGGRALLVALAVPLVMSCEGPRSTLDPAGRDAERIAELFWWMAGGAALIWAIVIGIAVYATRFKTTAYSERAGRWLIIGGGAVVPTITLTILLVYGLQMMPALLQQGPDDGIRITVVGEQWWWRVTYALPDGRSFELANELRLPVGYRMPLVLKSPDVIHALWVPSIAGKVDMIPGRTNLTSWEPTRTGVFRGACAEYCGTSHAHMNLFAVVLEQEDFEAWIEAQLAPAATPEDPIAEEGRDLFRALGCGACHTVRGTDAVGVIGPDLTHVGSRESVGAGLLENDVDGFRTWLEETGTIKPDVHMPTFAMLPEDDLTALATWLDALR